MLLTGASGALGRVLAKSLAAEGWTLRLTDIAPFPDAVPPRASFTRADLNDTDRSSYQALVDVFQQEGVLQSKLDSSNVAQRQCLNNSF